MKFKTEACPCCGSAGEIEVSPALCTALDALAKIGGPATREEIHDKSNPKRRGSLSASYHRVNHLLKMGVIKRCEQSRPERFQLV